ncbi:BnaCnng19550D [Brassica napus]|uniref:BnaCnng19550D protein n=2 Tax=Brassica napus TaxID=3708 RepID=A0A078ILA5_BRANA|nr:BnaCnng19550D [Brassica napus]
MIPHLLPRPSPSRLRRIGSIRLVQSVQDPAQGQELLLRHVLLLQRRHEDVHPRRQPSAARLLSFDQALLRHGIKLFLLHPKLILDHSISFGIGSRRREIVHPWVAMAMYIRVKRMKATYFIQCDPKETVLDVKHKLFTLIEKPVSSQRLVLMSTEEVLEDSKSLAEQQVENDAVVALTLRKDDNEFEDVDIAQPTDFSIS